MKKYYGATISSMQNILNPVFLLLLILFAPNLYAQTTSENNKILLVRLMSRSVSIEALRKSNYNDLADKIEHKQKAYNLKITTAFRNEFKFCPVYFFSSEYSDLVRGNQLGQVKLMNSFLEYGTIADTNGKEYLTAEFGTLDSDTAVYQDGAYYMPAENKSDKVSRYYSKPNMNINALVIMSDQLIQLRRPFPYYVRTFGFWPLKRRPKKVVRKMNRKLHKYYRKTGGSTAG